MNDIRIPTRLIQTLVSESKLPKQSQLHRAAQFSNRRHIEIDPSDLTQAEIRTLWDAAKGLKTEASWKEELEFLYRAAKTRSETAVKSVREFHNSFEAFINDNFIKGWLFQRAAHGAVTPYLVTAIEYRAAHRSSIDDSVMIRLQHSDYKGSTHNHSITIYFSALFDVFSAINREAARERAKEIEDANRELAEDDEEDEDDRKAATARKEKLRKAASRLRVLPESVPVDRVLAHLGFYKENEDLHEAYKAQTARFLKLIPRFGAQLRLRGDGEPTNSDDDDDGRFFWRRYRSAASMLVEGKPGRGILDSIPFSDVNNGKEEDEEDQPRSVDDYFPVLTSSDAPVFKKSVGADGMLTVPLHLTLRVFHLELHQFYMVHVVNIGFYKYKPELSSMLVLPPKVDRVAKMLMASAKADVDDIIEGKSQGRVITCIGDPGLGKTLLAEVLSEAIAKPLYKVQAAQLGLDAESLEARLRLLLSRAERWDCILMIDEANAYIHDRGVDVNQNAIVGVFLRLLEYFRGTLVLTTNQTTADGSDMDIDDAILSRSNAVIRFELPTASDSKRIWEVQRGLLKANISEATIDKAVGMFKYSGRSIRQLLRLARDLAVFESQGSDESPEITLTMLKEASEFIPISRVERRAARG